MKWFFETPGAFIGLAIALYFMIIQAYFYLAKRYHWVDKPNERSSHTKVTIVGAGVIFYFALLFFELHEFLGSGRFSLPYLFIGATLLAVVSFVDDRIHLPNKIRISSHFIAAALMFWELDIYHNLWWVWVVILFVLVVGTMNAYNFMDGINGITGLYSVVTLGTILYLSGLRFYYLNVFLLLAVLVFLFYNLRKKAVCFCGDVGSITISYLIIFLLLILIINRTFDYMILLLVYGVDSILTIISRIKKGENIFKAHRSHIYQLLVHERGWSHIQVSFSYALVQLLINVLYIYMASFGGQVRMIGFFGLVILMGAIGIYLRNKLNNEPSVHT